MTWNDYIDFSQQSNQNPRMQRGQSSGAETQSPSQQMGTEVPETAPENPETHPLDNMTLDQLLNAPGRSSLKKLDPKRLNGSGWYKYTGGITKSVKKIMESDFSEPAPNWTLVSGDTRKRWFKAFVQKFNWDSGITTEVREKFEEVCADRLGDYAYEWKRSWKKGKEKPTWMRNSVWNGLIAYWEVEKNKTRSTTNSKNRNSPRGGFGMAKHTCGSKPYVRKREEMRNPETGEYPDMVTFMEETHKRKDGTFVDKKAEAIARKCREMEQEKLTQLSQLEDTPADYQLSQVEKDMIFRSEVEVRKGRRYGVGSIPFDNELGQSSNFQSYEEKYRQTQTELTEAKEKIKEMDMKLQDAAYWAEFMAELHPNYIPPSQRN